MREGGGGGCGVSTNEYSCAHGAQINFADLTAYLTYGSVLLLLSFLRSVFELLDNKDFEVKNPILILSFFRLEFVELVVCRASSA
jgi:hypothetical protein